MERALILGEASRGTDSAYLNEPTTTYAEIKRLHRISGQIRGIEPMVERERYCVDF